MSEANLEKSCVCKRECALSLSFRHPL